MKRPGPGPALGPATSKRGQKAAAGVGRTQKQKRDAAGMTDDDRDLWRQVAKTLTHVDGLKPRIQDMTARLPSKEARWPDGQAFKDAMSDLTPAAVPSAKKPKPVRSYQAPSYRPPQSGSPQAQAAPHGAHLTPPLAEFEKRKARKLGRGSVNLDGRIDLHGMRQAEAHQALRRFLASRHAGDARWVLVITGKGQRAYGFNVDEFADQTDWSVRSEPGVLRRMVPQWLAEPDLRLFVVSYQEAAPQHGGSGALYVQMRRRKTPAD